MYEIKITDDRIKEFKAETNLSSGYDLRAAIQEPIHLVPGATEKIPTGIAVCPKPEFMSRFNTDEGDGGFLMIPCAIVMPRSGLGCKGIRPRNAPGLIDADYQGEIVVCLYNGTNDYYKVNPMDRIAQLVFTWSFQPVFERVKEFTFTTDRGAAGFGSTGHK